MINIFPSPVASPLSGWLILLMRRVIVLLFFLPSSGGSCRVKYWSTWSPRSSPRSIPTIRTSQSPHDQFAHWPQRDSLYSSLSVDPFPYYGLNHRPFANDKHIEVPDGSVVPVAQSLELQACWGMTHAIFSYSWAPPNPRLYLVVPSTSSATLVSQDLSTLDSSQSPSVQLPLPFLTYVHAPPPLWSVHSPNTLINVQGLWSHILNIRNLLY